MKGSGRDVRAGLEEGWGKVMFAAKLKLENHIGERETSGTGAARPSMEKVHP